MTRFGSVSALLFPIVLILAAPTFAADSKPASTKGRPGGVVSRGYAKALSMSDSDRAAAREASMSRAENPRSPHANALRSTYVDNVDGRRNPELFFRYELFDELLMALCPENAHREAVKRDWGSSLRSLGVDDASFWEQLEKSVGSYRSAHCLKRGVPVPSRTEAVRITNAHGDGKVTVRVDLKQCRSRAAAFQSAQSVIGKATLSRILYGMVAPVSKLSYSTSDEHHVDAMLYIEGGCRKIVETGSRDVVSNHALTQVTRYAVEILWDFM